jgi:ribosomal-protein-alanine N-acetyltransferase
MWPDWTDEIPFGRLAHAARRNPYEAPVKHTSDIRIRRAALDDLDDLVRIEERVFPTDRVPRRGFRRFLASPSSLVIVAAQDRTVAGYALVLFRANSEVARLYSIAVAPHARRRGIGVALLAAIEAAALTRRCAVLRLEVHEKNAAAIARYRKAGYALFGRHTAYYADRGHALRFEKRLTRSRRDGPHAHG